MAVCNMLGTAVMLDVVLRQRVVLDSSKDCAALESWTACQFSTFRRTVLPRSPGPLVGSRQFEGLWCLGVLDRLSVLDSSKDCAASESWTTCQFSTVQRTVLPQSPGPFVTEDKGTITP